MKSDLRDQMNNEPKALTSNRNTASTETESLERSVCETITSWQLAALHCDALTMSCIPFPLHWLNSVSWPQSLALSPSAPWKPCLAVFFAARSVDLDRRPYIGGLVGPPIWCLGGYTYFQLHCCVNLSGRCPSNCVVVAASYKRSLLSN